MICLPFWILIVDWKNVCIFKRILSSEQLIGNHSSRPQIGLFFENRKVAQASFRSGKKIFLLDTHGFVVTVTVVPMPVTTSVTSSAASVTSSTAPVSTPGRRRKTSTTGASMMIDSIFSLQSRIPKPSNVQTSKSLRGIQQNVLISESRMDNSLLMTEH